MARIIESKSRLITTKSVKRQQFTLRMNYPVEYGWKGRWSTDVWRRSASAEQHVSGPVSFLAEAPGRAPEVALMNWPRQDYAVESILDRAPGDLVRILQDAKRTSLAFLYWIQTELGHSEVKLRPDMMGTADGFSKYPYVRESRRMIAKGRVLEQDIVDEFWPGPRARPFDDSIGIGFYMVDIHPCGANERAA